MDVKYRLLLATLCISVVSAFADPLLWLHFDECAPGEKSSSGHVFLNAASSEYGSGAPHSIDGSIVVGTEVEFMPKYADCAYSELKDTIYDPVSGLVYTNRSSISFTTQGTSSVLNGGAVIIEDVEQLHLTNFTVECFVCTTGGTFNTIAPIIGMVTDGKGFMNEAWQIGMLTNGKLFMRYCRQPSNATTGNGVAVINDGKWHHVALVCSYDEQLNESKFQMYVDYRLDFTMKCTNPLDYGKENDIYIGGYKLEGRKFNGLIDEVRISDVSLTPNLFMRRFSPFVDNDTLVYMPFDGVTGTVLSPQYMNYAVPSSTTALTINYASFSTTNAVLSDDVYSHTLRDNPNLPPVCANRTSLSVQTNGVPGNGVGLYASPCNYTATNFTAELFFKAEGKMIEIGPNEHKYSQTLLKFSGNSPIQLTFNQSDPGMLHLVCHNGYGLDRFTWTSLGYFGKDLDDGCWHHVAVVYSADDSSIALYIDYAQVYKNDEVRLPAVNCTAFIGHGGETLPQFFHGKIDSVRFMRRILSPDEFLSPLTLVYNGLDDVIFYAPFNGTTEGMSSTKIVMGDGMSRGFEGCEKPSFADDVKYPELRLDGKEGTCFVTNNSSLRVNGSQLLFKNIDGFDLVDRIGEEKEQPIDRIIDHTAEFYYKLSNVGNMAGVIRVNNDVSTINAAPVWAIYVGEDSNHRLSIRCSTITNGVLSTERYLSTTILMNDLIDDEWHHFAMTTSYNRQTDRQEFNIFIDGVLTWSGSLLGYLHNSKKGFNVAMGYSIRENGNITGCFDEVKITRGILPPSKFMCRYRRPRGTVVTVR